ncbi:MAG: methyltransferase, partial [Aeromicrobium sp.]|uniref:class I SAM-dependent methyltransferase n=1 Tax=Aeromicrobium sp. TaxID=1871063 RepID=UPI003C695A3D
MGPVRTEVMWQSVLDAVEVTGVDALRILDLGGGTGSDAVRLAQAGHHVTIVDPSPDALASLERRSADAARAGEVPGHVRGVLGDTTDLLQHVDAGSFELVLCHGVLEHVDDTDQAMSVVASALRTGAHASVVV